MHPFSIRQHIVDRVVARRGRYHLHDRLPARKTAFVVIDMQPTFVAPGSPAEVPESRSIVGNINRLAAAVRAKGGLVIWVTHANQKVGDGSDWSSFYDHFVAADVRARTIDANAPRPPRESLWHELQVEEGDVHVSKNRYSALAHGSSGLERVLRSAGITTLLIAGTKTNICCESTGRDAMMLDFFPVMVPDCLAALSDEEHRAALETFIQNFGDVYESAEVIERLD
ncbi:MAG: isochorismatase family cysteine hydrolase [Pigmentiphaga sp.]|uniref:isochorismatase family cysteine hydrolase n=1 Tax=Pigmentiphaga sp. TaxID=1977564 RepID=UPI0029ACEE64|nr:isochorismatase family cysteine hydrolase [Pigmentiphaga sp.]MDX3905315.1 isochorismatase family cysteine hydrolase [Pigmentiphaga sp.]